MTKLRKTWFISDLHLDADHPAATNQFFSFLKQCDSSVEAIYILGDLFEAWIGDDDDTPFHRSILTALKSVTQRGIPIYLLHGNRDFLIGRRFLRASGCQLLPEETKIILYGTPLLLMHGDTLCTKDVAYLKWRKKSRNPIWHTLCFLILPLFLRRRFADKMRMKSKTYTETASQAIMDVTQEEVDRVMKKHEVHYLIHGHTHRPQVHHFMLNQCQASRMVLGAWHGRGIGLLWDSSGHQALVEI